jgi:acetoin:2,6-dichlorophenolindophenol oxidoreductase subunit beta
MSIDFRTAIRDALKEELARDETVMFFGEDVAAEGGVFKVTPGLTDAGPQRVFDTPISELAITSAAFGAAVTGRRPVIEIMFGDFLMLSMDSIVNQAAKYWYVSGGQHPVPMVVRSAVGAGARFGPIHSQDPASWFMSVPGLKIVCPSTPGDAKGLLKASIRDNNPVLFLEHKRLYSLQSEADDGPEVVPIGTARIAREGTDLSIVTAMKGVHDALAAGELLEGDGVSVEVVDLRTLRPLDMHTILASVRKTNRVMIVEEGPYLGGWGSTLAGAISQLALDDLDDLIVLSTQSIPVPFSPPLENHFMPGAETIVDAIRNRAGIQPKEMVANV